MRGIPELAVTEMRNLASQHITKAVNNIKSTRNRADVMGKQKEKSCFFSLNFVYLHVQTACCVAARGDRLAATHVCVTAFFLQ